MMKKIKIALCCVLGLMFFSAQAQDPHFTQFYASPLYLNPAFAGAYKCPKFNLNYRNQYPVINAYSTYAASYDQFVDALNGGLGMQITVDDAGQGTMQMLEFSGMYSYHLTISRDFSLLVGFQGTYRQRSLDWSKLIFPDQLDPQFGNIYVTNEIPGDNVVGHVDFSTGFIGFGENFYFGGAFHHITQPDDPFLIESKLPMKMTFHAGATLPIGSSRSETVLSPGLLYQQQGGFTQLNYLLSITTNNITGGLSFRHSFNNADAITVLLGYQVDKLRIGYSYDYTVSSLSNAIGGAHEVSVSYQLNCKPKQKKFKTINCPKF